MAMFHFDIAYEFYKQYIYDRKLQGLLVKNSMPVPGSVPSVYWELFGAFLTGDKGKQGYGSDLIKHEIKSAVAGASFEYQYHLLAGEQKLTEDMVVTHVFFSYSKDYADVDVRIMSGEDLKGYFSSWLPELRENYAGPNKKQRFRKNIPFGFVNQHGRLIMQIRSGKLVKTDSI